MIEDLNEADFNLYLRKRNYTPEAISHCNSFLFNEVHGTCADILKIEDMRDYVEQILHRRYNSHDRMCQSRKQYLTRLQEYLRSKEVQG